MPKRKKHPFVWVDAFTDRPFAGNPCAIIFEADTLDDNLMLQIASEMALPETAFVCKSTQADFRVRYFTPEREIPLAGHPTIATTYAFIESGRFQPKPGKNRLTLELRDGPIEVEVLFNAGAIENITMFQRKPVFMSIYKPSDIASIFGLKQEDFLSDAPIQTVDTGTPMLMVPVKNVDVLRKIELHFDEYRAFRAHADFFSSHFFCLGGYTPMGDTFARHLSIPPDIVEDAFTGSATGCMGAYLWKYQLIQNPRFVAEQGHWMGRPGQATVEITGPPDAIESVMVGGTATKVMTGELEI